MGLFSQKILTIPSSSTEKVEAVRSWKVQWISRHGSFSSETSQETEVFTNKEVAEKFAQSLKDAFKFLRHTSGTMVTVLENKKLS